MRALSFAVGFVITTQVSQPILLAAMACSMLSLSACNRLVRRGSPLAVPYTTNPPVDMTVNVRSRHLNSKGLRAMEVGHLHKAEQFFREALESDLNFGPAHNNLGHLFLARHQLYLAAWEFEYAASLMPELVEPIINQGLAYESGERIDRAAEFYQQAYDQQPHHPAAIASLVRARIKQDGDPAEIGYLLDELIMYDGRPEWVEWAKELRSTKYRDNLSEKCEFQNDSSNSELFDPENVEFQMNPASGEHPSDRPLIGNEMGSPSMNQFESPGKSILVPMNQIPGENGKPYWESTPMDVPLGSIRNLSRPPSASPTNQTDGQYDAGIELPQVRQASFDAPIATTDEKQP